MVAQRSFLIAALATFVAFAAPAKERGMSFAHSLAPQRGYGSAASDEALADLQRLGVDSVALTPFGFQRSPSDTEIHWVGNRGHGIGETDDAIRAAARQARAHGMRVMLKPHLWLRPPEWPGSIDHRTPAEWDAWFVSYRAFALHYAAVAQEIHAETFCIGNELTHSVAREQSWRALIRDARRVYRGRITYGANHDEVFDVPFWDALDAIGVSAYFSVDDANGWRPVVAKLAALSAKTKRPILFTELGYANREHAAREPWKMNGKRDDAAQAAAFETFFRAVWPQPWLAGVYVWKWESFRGHSGDEVSFAIENRPAAAVIRRHFAH